MLTIRLTRKGKKNQPFFRVVVIDKRRSASGGRPAEILGYVNPLTKKRSLKKDRILYWLGVGAQPSATIHNLLVSEKIIEAKKIKKDKKSKKPVEATATPVASAPAPAPTPITETPVETPAPAVSAVAEAMTDKEAPAPVETLVVETPVAEAPKEEPSSAKASEGQEEKPVV